MNAAPYATEVPYKEGEVVTGTIIKRGSWAIATVATVTGAIAIRQSNSRWNRGNSNRTGAISIGTGTIAIESKAIMTGVVLTGGTVKRSKGNLMGWIKKPDLFSKPASQLNTQTHSIISKFAIKTWPWTSRRHSPTGNHGCHLVSTHWMQWKKLK